MAIISAGVIGLTAVSLAKVNHLAFSGLDSNKIALQAQQHAASKAELIRSIKYDNLAAQNKTIIQNSNFQDEVKISAESDYPSDNKIKQKICTINVYKIGESLPRCSLEVTRTSVQLDSGVPQGSIIPWYGQIKDIPSGFALCDGKNNTPDLRDRFIVGAGNEYNLGDIGGLNEVILKASEIGSHYHGVGDYHQGNNSGLFFGLNKNETFILPPDGGTIFWNGSNHGGWFSAATTCVGEQITSLAIATEAQKPHENRPPYYALYYIMKL